MYNPDEEDPCCILCSVREFMKEQEKRWRIREKMENLLGCRSVREMCV